MASADFSERDRKLLDALNALGPVPDPDNKEELQRWLVEQAQRTSARRDAGPPPAAATNTVIHVPPPPRLPIFSGAKSDAAFDLWKYELACLRKRAKDQTSVLEAVNRSLRGSAARIVMHLGENASLQDIVQKLTSIYGEVGGSDEAMAALYNATQQDKETVSEWSCRLEDLASKALHTGQLRHDQLEGILRNRLFHGLKPHLRHRAGHKFDAETSFDQLREELRKIESADGPPSTLSTSVKSAQAQQDDKFERLFKQQGEMMKAMTEQFQAVVNMMGASQQPSSNRDQQQQGGGRGRGRGTCYYCSQPGHIKSNCELRQTHLQQRGLNPNGPAPRGNRL